MADQSQNPGAVTNTFNKGMVKDYNDTFVGEGLWTHARNAVNNSHDGQIGVLGNEPANLKCVQLPYTYIGGVYIFDEQWVVFTTDNTHSEVGIFDEGACTYTKLVNDSCLNFSTSNLITAVYRKRYDCERLVYFDDGRNPTRFLDIDNIPWKYTEKVVDSCIIKTKLNQLDCEAIRLAPLMKHPCFKLERGKAAGTLANGSYQVCMAYTINGIKISDYIGFSNIQGLFTHQNLGSSLDLTIEHIDTRFDEYELVVISTINSQAVAKKLGIYSTSVGTIHIDAISPELTSIPIEQITLRTEPVEKTDATFTVNNYLIRVGTHSKFMFNYQKQANKIRTKWVAVEYNSDYYHRGGHNTGYMRDEQYSFFIRWVYNTGSRSASFHIPGRSAIDSDLTNVIGGDAFETNDADSLNFQQRKRWQVQNTATIDSLTQKVLSDGGTIIASGRLAYWESSENYPANRPDIWGDLCGKPIRHHKFPDETVDPIINHFHTDGTKIVIMGVSFENITHPLDEFGNPDLSIVGYEILRGSREGNKTIIAKGLINNMRGYDIPGTSNRGLYQNYPYNDLRPDDFLTSNAAIIDISLAGVVPPQGDDYNLADTDDDDPANDDADDDSYKQEQKRSKRQRRADRRAAKQALRNERRRLGDADKNDLATNLSYPLTEYKKDYLSFHSPDTTFTRPFLSATELKVYQEVHGRASGIFSHPYKHPKFKTVTNFAAIFTSVISTLVGIGNALSVLSTESNINLPGSDKMPYGKKLSLTKIPNHSVGGSFFGSGVTFPNPVIAVENAIIGVYNATLAVAMTYIEATAVGEQLMNVIFAMIPKRQNALQYDSHGYYNQSIINRENNRRFSLQNAMYIDDGLQTFDLKHTINNAMRSNYVALRIGGELQDPQTQDTSRYRKATINGQLNKHYGSTISGYYGALKVQFANQYGQLESIKQMIISDCVHDALDPTTKYSTDVMFGGDTYINRFTEKNAMFFFNHWLMGEPDETEIDYRNYINIAYPRFWIDSERKHFKLFSNVGNYRHLDERESSIFFVSQGYFYLFYNGIRDFFVESEINLAYRDWEDNMAKRHYDPYGFQNYTDVFRSDIVKSNNYYKYDYSLSISKLINNYSSWGTIYPRDYDPKTAASCYEYSPHRVIYSLPQEIENKKDNWRAFLTNNYYDFKSPVVSIRQVNKTGALFMMNYESPVQFLGVDQLQTDGGTKITIGDGGLFNQALQSIVNSDDSYEYGSCQSRYSVQATTHGVFWVSQNQGKVFQFAGQLDEISKYGMKYWFSKYLPSELLKSFPDYPLADNPVAGIGVQSIYDNVNEILYISKKDYKPVYSDLYMEGERFYRTVNGIRIYYTLDSEAFQDASWTVSYDPKLKMWLSYHDWIPTFMMPSKTHFMTVNKDSIWKHNVRCDLFCNYYGVNYPFEVEFPSVTGQTVTTVRNVEYLLEAYKFYNNCRDKFHILDENFDQAMIYNSEQVSGVLEMSIKSKTNPVQLLNYPQVGTSSIKINFSKEENKYRFNQFWDITKNRGEFVNNDEPMFNTSPKGYIYPINPNYVNYGKASLERKKFRHNINKVFLRKTVSGNVKLLFKISNQKIQQSFR
jgi:hypothetical protein